MPTVDLLGGTYQARSIIADDQLCMNLFPEINLSKDADAPLTHYPTPGLQLLALGPVSGVSRCNYRSSNGNFYRVVGQNVYSVNSSWVHTLLGSLTVVNSTPVYMSDNGLVVVIVDGSAFGFAIEMSTNAFAPITDPSFLGGTRVDYVDTFFVLNDVGTKNFYSSLSNVGYLQLTGNPGSILTGSISAQGTGYVNGTYTNITLTGGTGTGATANIVVLNNVVTQVTIVNTGAGYTVGDSLTAALPSGTGFSYGVNSIGGFAFDPLDIAAKTGSPDPLVVAVVVYRQVWLIGELTTEVWYDAAATTTSTFPFQEIPGAFIEHGCLAPYSVSKHDLALFWISQDREGNRIVVKGENYVLERVSTHAVEFALASYDDISDCVSYCYQQEGHVFIVFNFPSADVTWVYDKTAGLWHQRCSIDSDGNFHRHRSNVSANVYGTIAIGDYANGDVYGFNLNTYTDNGTAIPRIRSMRHLENDRKRVSYKNLVANFEVGTDDGSLDNSSQSLPPLVFLSCSDDAGKTYGNAVGQSLGALGKYLTSVKWNRLGMARDRVFRLSWSSPTRTALNSVAIDVDQAGS